MSDPIPPKSDATPRKPHLWQLDPNDPKDLDVVAALEAKLAEERRGAHWLHPRESVKIPPELRQDTAVQTAIIVAAAQDVKVEALRKGMADKYKDSPEIHDDATSPEDLATRLFIGSKVLRASKGDVAIIDNAEEERDQAGEDARQAVAHAAGKLGINDKDQVNLITNALEAERRQALQGNAPAPSSPKAPERQGQGR